MNSAEIAKEILAGMNLGLVPRGDLLLKLSGQFFQLDHYLFDSDIREKDKVYREMQENCLRIFLGLVANGEYEKAGGISFLFDCK